MMVKVDKLESNQLKPPGQCNSDQIRDRCETGGVCFLTPEILEAGRGQFCVPDRVLDISVTQISLQARVSCPLLASA
jgi:hypothetical protein